MTFINSWKLFATNWVKTLKFFLYYVVIWGICFALLLPVVFEFKDILTAQFKVDGELQFFSGVFDGSVGLGLYNFIHACINFVAEAFKSNLGISIYGLIVVFLILPILLNIGKYVFYEMMFSYMTSKSKLGFFNALAKSLKKSLPFAVCKTFYNMFFVAIVFASIYGLALIGDINFVKYALPILTFVTLVLLYTLHQITVLGWASAMIVFDCNVFTAYGRGFKAVRRHFWATFATSLLYFVLFWTLIMIFGFFTFVIVVPFMTGILCIYDMVAFFTSQGMRFYVSETKIMTPKKLEEVDNINKTAFIL